MPGWIMIFAIIFLGTSLTLAANLGEASVSLKLAAVISGFLLVACILTRVARGRA
jgi:hypothetical protein